MPDNDLTRAALGNFPRDYNSRMKNLRRLLRKVDPEMFVRELAEEIDTHGVSERTLRFLENTAMHVADEMGPREKEDLDDSPC